MYSFKLYANVLKYQNVVYYLLINNNRYLKVTGLFVISQGLYKCHYLE